MDDRSAKKVEDARVDRATQSRAEHFDLPAVTKVRESPTVLLSPNCSADAVFVAFMQERSVEVPRLQLEEELIQVPHIQYVERIEEVKTKKVATKLVPVPRVEVTERIIEIPKHGEQLARLQANERCEAFRLLYRIWFNFFFSEGSSSR